MARLLIVEDNTELALLISAAARTRGHSPVAVYLGQHALDLLAQESFDLAIIDLLLPDLQGTELLEQLKSRQIPAIAISGAYRGDPVARSATEVYGAVAYFEKPFQLRALLDRATQALPVEEEFSEPVAAPSNGGQESWTALEALPELEPLPPDTASDEPLTPTEAGAWASPEALPELEPLPPSEDLTASEGAAPPTEPSPELSPEPALEPILAPPTAPDALELRLDDLPELAVPVVAAAPPGRRRASGAAAPVEPEPLPFAERERVWQKGADGESKAAAPVFDKAGDVTPGSVPRLLNAYYQAHHSGQLKLRLGNVVKVVYFESGRPVYAASNLASERFARFCVKKDALQEAQIVTVAAAAKERGLRTGEAMVALGILTDAQRRRLLESQVKEIIWSTFGWERGEYTCDSSRPNRADLVQISVFPGALILEGVQSAETLLSLRKKMVTTRTLFPTADPPYALSEIPFTTAQAQLLASADGSKTVEDLLALTELTEREALALLYACELMGLLEERRERGHRRISFGL